MIDPYDVYNFIRDEYEATIQTYKSIQKEEGSPSEFVNGYASGKEMILQKMMTRFLMKEDRDTIIREVGS